MAACWRTLAQKGEIDLSIIAFKPPGAGSEAPFTDTLLHSLNHHLLSEAETADDDLIRSLAEKNNPDIIMVNGWILSGYRKLTSAPALGSKPFIMTMDTPYRGTLRQQFAKFPLKPFLSHMNAVMVPGERAWQYARRLGFDENQIRRGMYSFDETAFAPLYDQRLRENNGAWPRKFLFVGRYAEEKAINILVDGYRLYCQNHTDPWPLITCGAGPHASMLQGVPHLDNRGFVQPGDYRAWAEAGAFVLASRFDPWGVVIAEAAAAGLPIVCTESVGASVELVRSMFNGMTVATENPEALAKGLAWVHQNHAQCPLMGQRSRQMAAAFSSEIWAQRVTHLCQELMS
ncbi:MAG TPA: glycosyltransferase family 4 protein [Tepidisphaeraceae bacterium]|jgi:glycosyltransferase involved in cell wall biosynthesis